METRVDFQRLLEDMDKAMQAKRRELSELDERLEAARNELSEREAKELLSGADNTESELQMDPKSQAQESNDQQQVLQRRVYEQQLEKFGDELAELESINQELIKENELLRRELIVSQRKCDQLEASARLLGENLREVQSANLELNLRLAKAESELNAQQKLLQRSHQEDEVLMDAFSSKLEALKKAIEIRDEEIARLRADSKFVLDAFGREIGQRDRLAVGQRLVGAHGIDTSTSTDKRLANKDKDNHQPDEMQQHEAIAIDFAQLASAVDGNLIDPDKKRRVIEILGAFREKETLIELLKDQLSKATKDLERNASLLERLSAKNGGKPTTASQHEQLSGACKCKMLENELETKDKQLHSLELRLHHFERILPASVCDLVDWLATNLVRWRQKRLRFEDDDHRQPTESMLSEQQLIEKMEQLKMDLGRLMGELNLSSSLLNQLEQMRMADEAKEAKIGRLVGELNRLDATYSFVQLDLDLIEEQQEGQQDPNDTRKERQVSSLSCSTSDHRLSAGDNATSNIGCCQPESRSQQPASDERATKSYGQRSIKQGQEGTTRVARTETTASGPEPVTKRNATGSMDEHARYDDVERRQKPMAVSDDSHQSVSGDVDESEERSIKKLARGGSVDDDDGKMKGRQVDSADSSGLANYLLPEGAAVSNNNNCELEGAADGVAGAALHSRLQSRLRQLKNENELLELAMKEILLSLKWSDGQCSTILIDCPSLERLCQLIEARFIATTTSLGLTGMQTPAPSVYGSGSSESFQWIVLKSELDLLRGQNEQLRAAIKNQRRDYCEFLSQHKGFTTMPNPSDLTETGCQTEVDVLVPPSPSEEQQGRCANCDRLIKLSNHLFQSVVRIETRVSVCDENYISRVTKLHHVVRMLERELTTSCNLLSESRRERSLAREQKLIIETRLQMLENQFNVHLKTCPLSMIQFPVAADGSYQSQRPTSGQHRKVHLYTEAKSTNGNSIQSLTIQSDSQQSPRLDSQQQMRGTRMTISLLQSIINCLQARLDYKDERLRQLEMIVSSGGQQGVADNEPSYHSHYPLAKPRSRLKIM